LSYNMNELMCSRPLSYNMNELMCSSNLSLASKHQYFKKKERKEKDYLNPAGQSSKVLRMSK